MKPVRTAIQTPDMNAIAERWVKSIKTECLNKVIPFGFTTLERSVNEFVTHYNRERPHQGIGNELIDKAKDSGTGKSSPTNGSAACSSTTTAPQPESSPRRRRRAAWFDDENWARDLSALIHVGATR